MSSLQNHPDDGILLRYLDGELPGRKAQQIRRHLEACWQCRTTADELQASIADCVRYRSQVLGRELPAPPAPWSDLSAGFTAIDREVGESWTARLGRALRAPMAAPATLRWSISGAAALLVAGFLYLHFEETPSVRAEGLLKRAVVMAETHPAAPHKIRVRTRTRQFLLHDRAAEQRVAALFQAARYDYREPLSARAYAEWRDSAGPTRDEVSTVADPEERAGQCYRIHTVTEAGELAAASLLLRTTDLHPVEGRFEFRNQEWVELSEFTEAPATEGSTNTLSKLEPPVRRAEPSRPAAVPSGGPALISAELRVLAALHAIGADLGDPIEVMRSESDGRVLVSSVGLSPRRQREVHRALDSLPNVTVDLSDSAPVGVPDPGIGNPVEPEGPKPSTLQTRLEKQLGGRVEFERLSSQMLDWTEAAMWRAHALRGLAQRFPADTEEAMAAPDRQLLNELARAHAEALSSRINDLRRTLVPVLVSLGGTPAQGRPANSAVWQPAAEEAFLMSRRVEMLLAQLMGVTPEPGNAAEIPSQLLTALESARSALDRCLAGIP